MSDVTGATTPSIGKDDGQPGASVGPEKSESSYQSSTAFAVTFASTWSARSSRLAASTPGISLRARVESPPPTRVIVASLTRTTVASRSLGSRTESAALAVRSLIVEAGIRGRPARTSRRTSSVAGSTTTALNCPRELDFSSGVTARWIPVAVGATAVEPAMTVGTSTATAGAAGGVDPGATGLSTDAAGPIDTTSPAQRADATTATPRPAMDSLLPQCRGVASRTSCPFPISTPMVKTNEHDPPGL